MRWNRFTAQQIIQIHVLYLIHDGVSGNQLADLRDGSHSDRQTDQRVDDGTTALLRRRGNCQQHLTDRMLFDQTGKVIRPQHRTAIDHRLVQIGVIVDKGHHAVIRAVIECIQQLTT
ncbi:MAG: Uncharacterised protein [Halieaceae bacterium]|nr:MAG: Uncharacterised protein [Halieaceae bacterium]